MIRIVSLASIFLCFACGCNPTLKNAPTSTTTSFESPPKDIPTVKEIADGLMTAPLPKRSRQGDKLFSRLPSEQTGIEVENHIKSDHPLRYLYNSGFACGGVALGDIDRDGRLDLFVSVNNGPNKLYRQKGVLEFEDVSETAGIGGSDEDWAAGAAFVDIDADGDLDIYVCNYNRPNQLFINQSSADAIQFSEEAASYGLDVKDSCLMPYFCDYDADGDLDVYIVCYNLYSPKGYPASKEDLVKTVDGRPVFKEDYGEYFGFVPAGPNQVSISIRGRRDYLLQNNGANSQGQVTFSDVTKQAGMDAPGFGLSAQWWDFDRDGDFDLYVANDLEDPDHLYQNNGDGTFTDVIRDVIPHTPYYSMGCSTGDLTGDGLVDCLVLDMAATTHFKEKVSMGEMNGLEKHVLANSKPRQVMRNALYVNNDSDRLQEAAHLTGLAKSDWSWTPALADFDNDGQTDVFITNGMTRLFTDSDRTSSTKNRAGSSEFELLIDAPENREQNLAFANQGDHHFQDVSSPWGLDHVGMSFAAAYGDLDGDGDLDLVVANQEEPLSIYRNESVQGRQLIVKLEGSGANKRAVGATVLLRAGNTELTRCLLPSAGFLSGNQYPLHFGLGNAQRVDELSIRWPNGETQTWSDLPANHTFIVSQISSQATPTIPSKSSRPWYRSTNPGVASHKERIYDDFVHQPLLPNKVSQLGPGLAWGDIDGDGDDDLFLGGAAGQEGQLFRNVNGTLEPLALSSDLLVNENLSDPFAEDAVAEDMGAVFFDAEGDGDLDLYVVSGSYEFKKGDPALADRLYLNNGKGRFRRAAAGAIPIAFDSGSSVCAADFDRDGDVDLFVGGRLIPGEYPLAAKSRLLVNESTDIPKFLDKTEELGDGLQESGLVTSACWSDANNDGWLDLLVTHEWGPIKFFKNEQGVLKDRTKAAGLADLLGWWNGIVGRDLDNDGDMDYAVTNFGLNTKYKTSPEKPLAIYYGEFDGKSGRRLVEAKQISGDYFPMRGRSCSSAAMPHLLDKFPSYRSFASASLTDVYTQQRLDEADRWIINELESGVLINDGEGRFEFRPLPRIAQISPAYGIVATELNGDGLADIYLVHNFFSPQIETGRHDGGLSLLLLGDGQGSFTPVSVGTSGLVVPGDAKSLAATDLNKDGITDFAVGVNDDDVLTFVRANTESGAFFSVDLKGQRGNPTAVGARVSLLCSNGSKQTTEVFAGNGYLSQSSPTIRFGLPSDTAANVVFVRWPDGSHIERELSPAENMRQSCEIRWEK